MPRLDTEYARISEDRYTHIYADILLSPQEQWCKTRSRPPNINPYLLYSLLTSPVQPDDDPVTRPKHVVVFLHTALMWSVVLTEYVQGVTGGTDQTSGGCSLC